MKDYMDVTGSGTDGFLAPAISGQNTAAKAKDAAASALQDEEELLAAEEGAESETAAEEMAAMKEEEAQRYQELLEQSREEQLSFFERLLQQMRQSGSSKNTGTKKLDYNYRKVSGAIARASTSTQASLALSSAVSAVTVLRRQAASGQYKSRDIEIALQHAQKMVRVARKKISNIKQELQQKKKDDGTLRSVKKKQQRRTVSSEASRQKKIHDMEKELQRRQEQKENMHRRMEQTELTMADLTYLKQKIDELKRDGFDSSSSYENDTFLLSVMPAAVRSSVEAAQEGMDAQNTESPAESCAESFAGSTAEAAGFDAMA